MEPLTETTWHPASWHRREALQQPIYADQQALHDAVTRLAKLPPLVTSWEIEQLKHDLAEVAKGNRFMLQGGDCSESFDDCEPHIIASKLKILLQMSLVLLYGSQKRIVRVGRFAGQYAKPRSANLETRGALTLPAYRGDLINRNGFTEGDREPNPELLLRGYERAALTLNFIRALVDGGFADLHHPDQWDLDFVVHAPQSDEYHKILDAIKTAIQFMEAVTGATVDTLNRVDFYTSHEGLHLNYEEAQTRQVPRRTGWYNLSTHFPWIGERTRNLDGAHIEYFKGIANPIGVKIGPTITPDELLRLIGVLNPHDEPGRLTLIHRMGVAHIEDRLEPLIAAVERSGRTVLWSCDPMHGNTERTPLGYKTRRFENILEELEQAFAVHQRMGTWLGGVHIELTGENVTECVGGARGLSEADLGRDYRSQVDPRLNYEQALELALLIANKISG